MWAVVRVIALGLLTGGMALAANQVLNNGQLSWAWVAVALSLALLTALFAETFTPARTPASAAQAERDLARAVQRQWQEAATRSGLIGSGELPIRWVVDGEAGGSTVADLEARFWSSPGKRMVITGGPGSGKTSLAILLLLHMLERQENAGQPVPFLLGLADWNPDREPFHDWLAGRIIAEHPWLASATFGTDMAKVLVGARRILPILDGFDEVPPSRQRLVVSAIEGALTPADALIIVSRSRNGRQAERFLRNLRRSDRLVVRTVPLPPQEVARYLRETRPASAGSEAGWSEVLRVLSSLEIGPLSRALARPLTLQWFRDVYGSGEDSPGELLDPGRFPHARDIERYLLSRYFAVRSSVSFKRRYEPEAVQRWLQFLAGHMSAGQTRELEWWRLPQAVSRYAYLATGWISATTCLVLIGTWLGAWIDALSILPLAAAGGYQIAFMAGRRATLLGHRPRSLRGTGGPRSEVRRSLGESAAWLFGAGGAAAAVIGALQWSIPDFGYGWNVGLMVGLAAGLAAAMGTPGLQYLLAVGLLAARGKIPWRLMVFLEQAERQGLLQRVGSVYRFRYLELQDLLAYRHVDAADVDPLLDPRGERSERDAGEPAEVSAGEPGSLTARPPVDTPDAGEPAVATEPSDIPGLVPLPEVAFPRTSKIDHVVREKVRDEIMVLPEVRLKIVESGRGWRREAMDGLVRRLLAANAEAIELAAQFHYQRYAKARDGLVEAARLPAWSRPAHLYRWLAWCAGASAAWLAGMIWLPLPTFRLLLGIALAGYAVLALIMFLWRSLLAVWSSRVRRPVESGGDPEQVREPRPSSLRDGLRDGARATARMLAQPLPPLLAVGLIVTFPFSAPGPGAVWFWAALAVAVLAILMWWVSAPSARVRVILADPDPASWLQLPPGLVRFRVAAQQAHQDWVRALVREGLLPLIRAELGEERDAMSTTLPDIDPGRLGRWSRIDEFVRTAGSDFLDEVIARHGSASIGLSGARGAGKSTALRRLCSPDRPQTGGHLCVLVHAPTAYDPKEFITHLFLRVCEQVTGETGEREPRSALRARLVRAAPLVAAFAGTLLLAGALQWQRLQAVLAGATRDPLVLVGAAGVALILAGLAVAWRRARRSPQALGSSASEVAARAQLRSLRYLEAVTQSSGGEMGLPGGSKVARQAAVQRTEHTRGYPQLVADLRELLGQIALDRQDRKGKVIIGIDELDKIGNAEETERFLNDLKVIFGVYGCFFLVALSEDAIAGYERRSLGVRNTFDSAFDRIIRIPALSSGESHALLARRNVPLPLPFVWLCHALTGGVPRDFLRTVLDLTTIAAAEDETGLDSLAIRLIRQDRATVLAAQLRVAARLSGGQAAEVTGWLAECADAPLTSAALDDLAERRLPGGEPGEAVVVQSRAYLSILAMLIRIFIEAPWYALEELRTDPRPIDDVAETRLLLATDPHLAWHTIQRIRRQVRYAAPAPPAEPAEAPAGSERSE
ncbi:NACHT domain-containing protein [Acrocarpospora catenulata]|uniref:NACHT domain-containing protein n=1 Tax=Acrocarpospora catenulata TaxID=2836182 RepID=UPI001BDB59D3|nr:NACHT domain-containing protein [Acrocarpospora catenulata]